MTSAYIPVGSTAENSLSSLSLGEEGVWSTGNVRARNDMLTLSERSKQNPREIGVANSCARRVRGAAFFAAYNLVLLGGALLAEPDASAWIGLFFPIMLASCTAALISQVRLAQRGI